MTNKCVVCGRRGKPGECLSFHRFPNDVERKNTWLKALKLDNANKWHYICSEHFQKRDYSLTKSNVKVLNKNAVPSLSSHSPTMFSIEDYIPSPPILPRESRNIENKWVRKELFDLPDEISIRSTSEDVKMYETSTSKEGSGSFIAISTPQRPEYSSRISVASDRTITASLRTITASEATLTASDSTLTASECGENNSDLSFINIDTTMTTSEATLTASDNTLTASELEENDSDLSFINIDSVDLGKLKNVRDPLRKKRLHSSTSSSTTVTASKYSTEGKLKTYVQDETTEGKEPPKKKRKLKRYVGDITSGDLATPTKAKRFFNLAKTQVATYRTKIHVLQKRNRRMKTRVTTLKTLLIHLKQNNFISENAQESIEASLPGPAAEMVTRILKGSKSDQYSPTLRAFALTLHFYSPRAYNYVREKFNKSLPHPSTVSKWYQKIDGSPGFTEESLNALKNKVEQNKNRGKETFGNLVMDEMSIRKKVEWVGSKFVGYVDIGANVDKDSLLEAKEVLVFLVTSVNGNWKIPVGYFCISGLSGSERANLVNQCLEFLHQSGIIITSLTFDGAASNISMANQLGANLADPKNLKTYFGHPVTKDMVFIFLDICHMIKLVRNCLGDLKLIKTKNGKGVYWHYLNELVNLQCDEGLNAGSKIKRRHMQYAREKMRVKIATQTFSKSVSDALRFLEQDLQLHKFQGAEETANFCLLFNDVFDILNSRNKFSTYMYKKSLSSETEQPFFNRFDDLREYILGLNINNIHVTSGPRKTGFLGFLIGMESFKGIYNKYIKSEDKLSFLLGYKFSQDHLETLFSSVRSMHGYNNNPTCRQFQSAYKKLLISREVRGADTANAVTLDNTLILNVSSRKITLNDDREDMETCEEYKKICEDLDSHDYFSTTGWQLSSFINDVIIYIAGFVVKSLKKCITCSKCLALLETNDTSSLLQKRKTFGNLVKASAFVSDICTWGEKVFRQTQIDGQIFSSRHKNVLNVIIHKTVHVLPTKIFEKFGEHIFDGEFLENHQLSLVKLILKRYFTIRIHHETRTKSDEVKNRVRSILTHLILYQNQ